MSTNEIWAETADGPARKELAKFLRARRERLTPEEAGITTSRSRRTPGLRREEVAFLADIGVKWYTRLETGHEVHPSPKTLLGISRALRMSRVDTEYLFDLADVSIPKERVEFHVDVPETATKLVVAIRGVMAAVMDLFLTPLRWNAITDAVLSYSSLSTPVERNALVRIFSNDDFVKNYTGEDYERVARDAVGMFRRYYAAGDPSPLVQQIYERIRFSPLFQELWDSRTVTDSLIHGAPVVRQHPEVGRLSLLPLDLVIPHRGDLVLKLWFPDDEESQRKFDHLETTGKAWSPEYE